MSVSTQTQALLNTQTLVLIAPHGSYRTMRYLQAAEKLNLAVMIISEGEHSIVSEYAQGVHVQFHQPEHALESILSEINKANTQVVSVIGTDDSVIEIAANVAKELGLSYNNVNSAQLARRKDLARKALKENKTPIPYFKLFEIDKTLEQILSNTLQDDFNHFPVVIKPLALSASRGVIRVNNINELEKGLKQVKTILEKHTDLDDYEQQWVLLEEYIHGEEIAVEGIVENGQFKLLTIFDKPDPLYGPYFEETYYITPSRLSSELSQQVVDVVQSACEAYGIQTGPVHAECRLRDSKAYLIEMAARTIGGLCSDILEYGLGCSLEEVVLRQSIGQAVDSSFSETSAGVLMIPVPSKGILKRVEGLLEAGKVEYIEDINIQLRDGYELIPLPEGNSYLGFVFAKAPSFELVEKALRQAYACLNVVVAPIWKIDSSQIDKV